MTIDEAIDGLKRIFSNYELDLPCTDSLDIESEIIVLLEELKDYRDKNKMVVRVDVENMDNIKDKIEELSRYAESQYNKAIDDFVTKYKFCDNRSIQCRKSLNCADCIAEQLKAGGENENYNKEES